MSFIHFTICLKVPFARANTDHLKSIATELEISQLPVLVLYKNGKPLSYQGIQNAAAVIGYVKKQMGKPFVSIPRRQDVVSFLDSRHDRDRALSSVMVVSRATRI